MIRTLIAAGLAASVAACASAPTSLPEPRAATLAELGHQGMAPASGGPAKQLVVFFHGYTQRGEAMRPLAEQLAAQLPDAAFVFNDAPLTANAGFSWYNFRGDDSAATKEAARAAAAELVSNLSNSMRIPPSKIVTVGFSQGGGIAAQAATCITPGAKAFVSLAGVIETVCTETSAVSPDGLIVWNQGDPMVDRARIDVGLTALKGAGYEPTFETYEGDAHWPAPPAIARAVNFIVAELNG